MRRVFETTTIILLATLLTACATSLEPGPATPVLPGVSAWIPDGLERDPDYHGIDSAVARFTGRGSVVSFDRGPDAAQLQPHERIVASPAIRSGQTFDHSTLGSGIEGYRHGIRLVERVDDLRSPDGLHSVPAVRLSIGIFCHQADRCEAIADGIQHSLSIRSDP